MTREERLELLKQIEKDIHVCSLESTLLDDSKSCAIHSVIEELEQVPVLDKIRAEIANHCGVNTDYCDSCRFCTDSIGVREILQIIDKYRTKV